MHLRKARPTVLHRDEHGTTNPDVVKLRQGLLLLLHIIIALEGGIEGRTFRQSSSVSITLDFMHACRFVMSSPISASCEKLSERGQDAIH